jgi:hypothetical protein
MMMSINQFIFSNAPSRRFQRHFVFWFVWYSLNLLVWPYQGFIYHVLDVLGDIVFSYTLVYFLIPTFLQKKKYISFVIGFSILTLTIYYYYLIILFSFGKGWGSPAAAYWNTLLDLVTNTFVVCILLYAMKVLRDWLVKDMEHRLLTRENANAELELLKARVHPHFLFNTLNNIYSFILNQSPQAAGLVLKLSATLKYMINDCEAPLVPVERELTMMEDYIGLEKVRYGDRLDLQVEIKGDYKNKFIAPLLLIPFVENSFKHGTSRMLRHSWVRLNIETIDDTLYFRLSNSKPPQHLESNGKKGIGLNNVQKRLELLYQKQYALTIDAAEGVFTVTMRIPLDKNSDLDGSSRSSPEQSKTFAYA